VTNLGRRAELADALDALRARIAGACAVAGRQADEVRLLAVTKTFPATDTALLADLGLTDFAENKDQEASRKVAELAELRPDAAAHFSMVGQLQRNKARSVARWADELQSLDSCRLACALERAVRAALDAHERSAPMDVLVQVNLDPAGREQGRGGIAPAEVDGLAEHVVRSEVLRLRGVMAVAPPGERARPAFDRLAGIAERLRCDHPEAAELSAGMSADLDEAIAAGSTCVRVGTALLGHRPLLSR
jgi:pyridoxal phosphate enzyme (YggS family)